MLKQKNSITNFFLFKHVACRHGTCIWLQISKLAWANLFYRSSNWFRFPHKNVGNWQNDSDLTKLPGFTGSGSIKLSFNNQYRYRYIEEEEKNCLLIHFILVPIFFLQIFTDKVNHQLEKKNKKVSDPPNLWLMGKKKNEKKWWKNNKKSVFKALKRSHLLVS